MGPQAHRISGTPTITSKDQLALETAGKMDRGAIRRQMRMIGDNGNA